MHTKTTQFLLPALMTVCVLSMSSSLPVQAGPDTIVQRVSEKIMNTDSKVLADSVVKGMSAVNDLLGGFYRMIVIQQFSEAFDRYAQEGTEEARKNLCKAAMQLDGEAVKAIYAKFEGKKLAFIADLIESLKK